jgi:hypothetical protein
MQPLPVWTDKVAHSQFAMGYSFLEFILKTGLVENSYCCHNGNLPKNIKSYSLKSWQLPLKM